MAKVKDEASTSKIPSETDKACEKDNYEIKLTDAIVKLVASIPKPQQKTSADANHSIHDANSQPDLNVAIVDLEEPPQRKNTHRFQTISFSFAKFFFNRTNFMEK